MRTSRKLAHALLALFTLVVMSSFALAADPGLVYPPTSEVSDQKQGSVLIYNVYTSGATSGNTQNTRINLTNTSTSSGASVHLFFVSDGCQIADSFICLTPTQTATFLASDVDPGVTGYVVAIATDGSGCPLAFNWLIGDLYVKFTSGHAANLGAEAFAALFFGTLPGCDANSTTATVNFNGVVGNGYNLAPRVLADSHVPSRADGNDTLIIINRISGNLAIGASTLGTLFGIFYDDSESPLSFSINGGCQLRGSLSDTFPRLTPRFGNFIPAGRVGWFKVYSQSAGTVILGAAINLNTNAGTAAGAFSGGHNLHKLTLDSGGSYVLPIFPSGC
ncbi:MAG: hypothetical protein ABI977_30435 [Acidobacteriota bacterium]